MNNTPNWTEHQTKAIDAVHEWFHSEDRKPIFRVFGYAGTGKTTLAKHFASTVNGNVLFGAFTGKAALMMETNGCYGARTLHSLIYKAVQDPNTGDWEFFIDQESPLWDASLLIVDECSMVNEEMGNDILSFGVPVLVLGDPAQLPPVKGSGFFTEHEPDVMLTEIHRQAKDDPIVSMATKVREGKRLAFGEYGISSVTEDVDDEDLLKYEKILVGRNNTRHFLNKMMRKMLGRDATPLPVVGDSLICLKNDKKKNIFNGGEFLVVDVKKKRKGSKFTSYSVRDINTDLIVDVRVHDSFFDTTIEKPDWKEMRGSQEFDFGYAITTHKAQGSQWSNVLIFDESGVFRDEANRWLYTALTRAQTQVTLFKL